MSIVRGPQRDHGGGYEEEAGDQQSELEA